MTSLELCHIMYVLQLSYLRFLLLGIFVKLIVLFFASF